MAITIYHNSNCGTSRNTLALTRVRLCRPSEKVLDILSAPQKRPFNKEDGEVVMDAQGTRIL
jgi:hypothetical protein